ncbi:MAG: hypothetical protein V4660_03410 [Pseudomonadota bacterium]
MSLFTHYRRYPQLSLCTALLLVLGFLGAFLYIYSSAENQKINIERYGQMLAVSSARQAVDATLTQDMVSLQAILQDVALYPNVIGTTLHNVDNKLLVQSGYKPKQNSHGKRYSFTAPVALHNNVVGYLEVTLEVPYYTAQDILFLCYWALAVAIALLIIWRSIYRQWWSSLRDKFPSANAIVSTVVENLPNIPEAFLEAAPTPEHDVETRPASVQIAVRLSIHVLNMNKLYQQLNSEGFGIVLNRFEKQLHILLSIYNGKRQLLTGEVLLIDFVGEELHDCSFRALCCAKILMNMTARNPSPRLQLAANIQPLAATPLPAKNNDHTNEPPAEITKTSEQAIQQNLLNDFIVQFNNPLTPVKNEIFISTSLLDSTLQEHAEFDITQGKLIQIKSPYSEHIAKQEEQLLLH